MDIARLGVEIDTTSLKEGERNLRAFSSAGTDTERRVRGATDSISREMVEVRTSTRTAATEAARSFDRMGDAAQIAGRRMRSVDMRGISMQLSQVAQQTTATGNLLQATAIQLPDIGLAFGTLGIAAGVFGGALLSLVGNLDRTNKAAEEAADRLSDFRSSFDGLESATDAVAEAQERYAAAVALSGQTASEITPQILENLRQEYEARRAIASLQRAEFEQRRFELREAIDAEQERLDALFEQERSYADLADASSEFARVATDDAAVNIAKEFVEANEGAFVALRRQKAELQLVDTQLERTQRGWSEIIERVDEAAEATEDVARSTGDTERAIRRAAHEYVRFQEDRARAAQQAEDNLRAALGTVEAFARGASGRSPGLAKLTEEYGVQARFMQEQLDTQREIARIEDRRAAIAAASAVADASGSLGISPEALRSLKTTLGEISQAASDAERAMLFDRAADGIIAASGGLEGLEDNALSAVLALTQGAVSMQELAGPVNAAVGDARMLGSALDAAGTSAQAAANQLAALGYDSTLAGVRAFQEAMDIRVDGIIGPETLGALEAAIDASDKLTVAQETAAGAAQRASDQVKDAAQASSATAEEAARSAETATQGIAQAMEADVGEAVAAIEAARAPANSAAEAVGLDTVMGLESGLSTIGAAVDFAFAGVSAAIAGHAGSAKASGEAVGRAVGDGLAAGLNAKAGLVRERAAALASAAADATRAALDIRSPSRVMAEIGEETAAGLADGITDGTDGVLSAAEDLALRLEDTFADGIGRMVDYMVDGFRDGLGGLVDIFKSTIKQMISYAIQNRIMIGLGMGGGVAGTAAMAGGGGIGGGVMSGILGAFGSGGGGIFGGLAGGTGFLGGLGNALSGGLANVFNIAGNAAGSFMGALGAAVPVLGAVTLAVGLFRKKTKELDSGLRVTTDGFDTMVESFRKTETSRLFGLLKSTGTDYEQAAKGLANPIIKAIGGIQGEVLDAAKALGVGRAAFRDFTREVKISTKGMSESEARDAIMRELQGYSDAFARMVGGLNRVALDGESATDTLNRVASSLVTVNSTLRTLGHETLGVSVAAGRLSARLTELVGGVDAFAQSAEFYFQNFYSLNERTLEASRQFRSAVRSLNVDVIPETERQFRRVVDRLMDNGRRAAAVGLIALAPLFKQIQGLKQEARDAAKAGGGGDNPAELAKRRDALAKEKAIVQERRRLQEQLWTLTGRENRLRRRQLNEVDATNRALLKSIFAEEDRQKAQEKAREAAQAARQEAQAARREAKEARRDARQEAREAAQEARQEARAIRDERRSIREDIWDLLGMTAKLRRRELASLDPTNRALKERYYRLLDEKTAQEEAAAAAERVADEREGLEERLLELTGNRAELQRRELAALDPTNRALQRMIWGLEAAAEAMDALNPEDFASRLDFLRASARARSDAVGMGPSGKTIVIEPTTEEKAQRKGDAEVMRQVRNLLLKIEGNTFTTARIARKHDVDGLPPERT